MAFIYLKDGVDDAKSLLSAVSYVSIRVNLSSGLKIFVEHWGDNLQFYPNFALFLTLGE